MKHCYYCDFCGKEFNNYSECEQHELSHNAMYFNHEEIEEHGIQHSGYVAKTAPQNVYLPMYKGVTKERIYGEYLFVRPVTRERYLEKYNLGEIVDD